MRTNPLPVITEKVEERFWAAVTPGDGCWLWNKCKDGKGYGVLNIEGKLYRSHRLAAQIAGMEIPPGQYVCHTCDVRACCNPSHFFIGSAGDNLRDMCQKKRSWHHTHPEKAARGDRNGARLHPERVARGERSGISPFNNNDIREIRHRASLGETYASISRHFGVTKKAISFIVKRRTWAHLD